MTDQGPDDILGFLLERYPGIVPIDAWGETSLVLNPGRKLAHGVYFATIKSKDGDNGRASGLDRDGVFRLNIGTERPLFFERFGFPPSRPGKGRVVEGPWDFKALNVLTPHPVYGWMCWVSVLNPSWQMVDDLIPLLDGAYRKASLACEKRLRSRTGADST